MAWSAQSQEVSQAGKHASSCVLHTGCRPQELVQQAHLQLQKDMVLPAPGKAERLSAPGHTELTQCLHPHMTQLVTLHTLHRLSCSGWAGGCMGGLTLLLA